MKRTLKPRYRFDQNAHHYQLLGLKRGECRIDVIRQAARQRATSIAGRSHPATVDLHRAEIAVAVYRLLDPRGRSQLYERVQLSCPLDLSENQPGQIPAQSPINRALNLAPQTNPSNPSNPSAENVSPTRNSGAIETSAASRNVRIMDRKILNQAIEQPADKGSSADEDDSARKFNTTDLSMVERRQFVELIKSVPCKNETKRNAESFSRSTVDWIRACLGI